MPLAYGFFPGGDPRRFDPDGESCTAGEVAAWRAACARWDAGDTSAPPSEEHGPWVHTDGRVVLGNRPEGDDWRGVCHRIESFGIGTYEYEGDEDNEDLE